jgi:uncharacterized membrane protein (UPF0127 family)
MDVKQEIVKRWWSVPWWWLAVTSTLLLGVGWLLATMARPAVGMPTSVSIGGQQYTLEIADTEVKRTVGLGGRDGICDTCGMLFLFESRGRYTFWMKDMRFALDIVWLLGDEVVAIKRDVHSDFSGVFRPEVSADKVLEFPASAGQGLNVGDTVRFNYE